MKIIFMFLLILILGKMSAAQTTYPQQNPPPKPIQNSDIDKFNNRLERIYDQKNQDTFTQQIVYGSVELVAAYHLNSFIPKVDQRKIASLAVQIKALKDPTAGQYAGNDLSPSQKAHKIRMLEKELKTVEGGIAKRMARGTTKILVRGAQVFLILDIGARVYVLNALNSRDPGFVPAYTFLCNQVDCDGAVDEVIETSNEAYIEARRAVEPKPVPVTPTPQPAPATPPAPQEQPQP